MKVLIATLALTLCSLGQAPAPSLKAVKRIYIERMGIDLDKYLRAEILKQFKGSITVVLDAKDADGILAGANGRYLRLNEVDTGTISLLDKEGRVILWSYETGDRSLLLGALKRGRERKVADRLVSKLKKAMEI